MTRTLEQAFDMANSSPSTYTNTAEDYWCPWCTVKTPCDEHETTTDGKHNGLR